MRATFFFALQEWHRQRAKSGTKNVSPPIPISINHPKFGRGQVTAATRGFLRVQFRRGEFWLPRGEETKKKMREERRDRSRLHKTLWRIFPDARPKGYRRVSIHTRWPSVAELIELAALGYPAESLVSALCNFPNENRAPVFDRRRSRPTDSTGDIGDDGDDDDDADHEASPYGSMMHSHPDHVVIAAPSRRTTTSKRPRISDDVFRSALGTKFDLEMQAALRDVVVLERPVVAVARARSIDRRRLSEAVRRIRSRVREQQSTDPNLLFSEPGMPGCPQIEGEKENERQAS